MMYETLSARCPECRANLLKGFDEVFCTVCGYREIPATKRPAMKDNELFEGTPRLIPSWDRVVVEKLEVDRVGHLFLPPSAQDSTTMGRVVETSLPRTDEFDGQDVSIVPEHNRGDLVLFGANSGYDVQVGLGSQRKRFIVLRASEILAKVVFEKEEPAFYEEGFPDAV